MLSTYVKCRYRLIVQLTPHHVLEPCFHMVLLFGMANTTLLGTNRFVGEGFVLVEGFQSNTFVADVATTGTVLDAAYALWSCNCVGG